ncbi:MAG: rhomboid family intramembrane serine protease [Aquisalinus sp.]|nr:rhomboid family intramembrane serine protease [Aquisalinus sp.]
MQSRPSSKPVWEVHQKTPGLWWPPALIILLLISVFGFVHFLQSLLPTQGSFLLLERFALSPTKASGLSPDVTSDGVMYTFLTHAFLHADAAHLILNSFWFYVFAQPLAMRFCAGRHNSTVQQLSGSFIFLAFFLSAAVFSGFIYVLMNLQVYVVLVGASGAISAVMGAAIRVGLRRFQPGGVESGKALSILDPKVFTASVLFIGSNLALLTPAGDFLLFGGDAARVAWEAHIAGYLYGLVMFSYFDRLTLSGR